MELLLRLRNCFRVGKSRRCLFVLRGYWCENRGRRFEDIRHRFVVRLL